MDTIRMRVFVALICIKALQASTVTFEASPTELKANLTNALSMRCSISDDDPSNAPSSLPTVQDVRHLSTIFVTRSDGKDVASMTLLDAPMAFVDGGNLEVKGFISTTSGEGYLQLSWRDPSTIYLGQYTCTVTASDVRGHTVHMTSDLQLTAATPSINDLIAYFTSKLNNQQADINKQNTENDRQKQDIAELKKENDQLKQALNQTSTDMKRENDQLKQALNQTNTNMSLCTARQNLILNTLTSDIARLKACTSLGVSFAAALSATGKFTLPRGQIKYNKLIHNEGNDYDVNTGNFVCSTPGTYSFQIHAESYTGHEVCLQLQVNGATIASLYAQDTGHVGAASTGATVHLQQGDVVRVMAVCSSYFWQQSSGNHQQPNILTGYLLKGDQCSA